MGGFYEKLIGMVKVSLNKLLNKRKVNLTEFTTLVTKVKQIVNQRPLVYINTEEIH